ncbi:MULTISPECIES: glycosyltransferase family 1 protein [unclassified Frigoribacterium]|uniref:glycosyltransferase family 4 protein n=1 Tax=unclassified Frigoribacterium TaxID=2627005 RepID=UPI001782A436|nr:MULTISPECIES: glycosyltransferase family 1 protein [unclassified Frigoribacterium]MBD8702472.1 glycosyltransferase family 4 protein [Frigoribacterium sp. CFBP 13712]MDY0891242.1 glycosyltransferase family 1 protein [Frigoribacterium sp. CFBP9030]
MPDSLGGVGRYIVSLVREVASRGVVELIVVVSPGAEAELLRAAPGARIVAAPALTSSTLGRFVWEQTGLPRLADRLGADVIHSPHYTMPLATRRARVVTLHDATFFSSPEWHIPSKARFFRAWTRLTARLADTVVTPSRATAEGVREALGRPLRRVVVAPLGVDGGIFHPPTAADRQALADAVPDLPATWIAFLGTLEPRKNTAALIRAARRVARERRAAGLSAPALLLAGAPGWDATVDDAVRDAADDLDVRLLGYLPLEALAAFLGDADCVAYPSLGEGFGLPVLEAMSCAAVVVTTTRLSLPEVGGDCVLYSDVDDASLAATLVTALSPASDDLRPRARERAETFDWASCAEAHERAWTGAATRGHR